MDVMIVVLGQVRGQVIGHTNKIPKFLAKSLTLLFLGQGFNSYPCASRKVDVRRQDYFSILDDADYAHNLNLA